MTAGPGNTAGPGAAESLYALSSGQGRAAVAVVRITGPAAPKALLALTGAPLPPPRRAVLKTLFDLERSGGAVGCSGFETNFDRPLDRALLLWFPGPRSFTGEDLVELQLHGGPAVVAAVLAALARVPGLAPAGPGDFTRRAFLNGRLDLAEVEGLADLIAAETEAQRRLAWRQAEGALSRRAEDWRRRLLAAQARLEAAIEFPDEALPETLLAEARAALEPVAEEIAESLAGAAAAERLRAGLEAVVVGPPNAGKSSLVNALAGRPAAIVSPEPGTTRDVIEVALDLGGYPLTLADTAGLRALAGEGGQAAVEAEGIRRAEARLAAADLVLVMLAPEGEGTGWHLPPALAARLDDRCLLVLNKLDLPGAAEAPPPELPGLARPPLRLSLETGEGLAELCAALAEAVAEGFAKVAGSALTARARQRAALEETAAALRRGVAAPDPELLAEDLRLGLRALGRLTGRVDVEDMLDALFAEFCIGK